MLLLYGINFYSCTRYKLLCSYNSSSSSDTGLEEELCVDVDELKHFVGIWKFAKNPYVPFMYEMLTATNMFVAVRAVLVLVRSSGIFLVDRNEQA